MIDKETLLEQISEEQVLEIMSEFGATPYVGKTKETEMWFNTICHCGSSHKLCYFRKSKSFMCYTNCGSMSLFDLVANVKDTDFSDAFKYVLSKVGCNNSSNRIGLANDNARTANKEINDIKRYTEIRKKRGKNINIEPLPELKTNILSYFEDDVFYKGWINEGISIETQQFFGIRWYQLEQHIIIPHYNHIGQLVGIRRRSLQEKDAKNKYMPEIIEGVQYKHPLNMNLYGLYEHIEAIKRTKKVVIVEAEKSVMLAHEYYGDNAFAVATCGFNVSNYQMQLLLSLGVEEVILAFDKDFDALDFYNCDETTQEYNNFLRFRTRIEHIAKKFAPYCRVYVLWDEMRLLGHKDSPFDKGKEILETLMRNKIEITTDM